jgi:hypothetical protein
MSNPFILLNSVCFQSNYLKIPDRYGIIALSVVVGILLIWTSLCDTSLNWLLEFKLALVRIFISSQVKIERKVLTRI